MIWETTVTALLTLAIYTILFGDNPIYKFAEHLLLGLTIGYSLVVTVKSILIPQAVTPIAAGNLVAIIPVVLGSVMFLRVHPKLAGWSQIPLALLIGAGAGASIPAMMQARVLKQASATISGSGTVDGVMILFGVLVTLMYFVFTKPHSGGWGKAAVAGRYFMMIFFGATFAYTVMSRMALLIGRLEFLLSGWLGVI
jgi:hypothetical protein